MRQLILLLLFFSIFFCIDSVTGSDVGIVSMNFYFGNESVNKVEAGNEIRIEIIIKNFFNEEENFWFLLKDGNETIKLENISMGQNEEKKLLFFWKSNIVGKHEIIGITDIYDELNESDERNNIISSTITIVDSGIDIGVEKLFFLEEYGIVGSNVSVNSLIKVLGTPNSFIIEYWLGAPYSPNSSKIGNLTINFPYPEMFNVSIIWLPNRIGKYEVYAIADPDGCLNEKNRENNIANAFFEIYKDKGNLAVSLYVLKNGKEWKKFRVGDYAELKVVLENSGPEKKFEIEIFNGKPENGGAIINSTSLVLEPNEKKEINFKVKIEKNMKEFYVIADPKASIGEENRTDNIASIEIEVFEDGKHGLCFFILIALYGLVYGGRKKWMN